jgi:hypothetical protein
MRRAAVIVCLAVFAAGVAAVLIVGATDRRALAFTLGVIPGPDPAAKLQAGQEACERGIDVPEKFDRIQLQVGTYRRPGPPLDVTVTDSRGARLGADRIPAGYPDVSQQFARVGDVPAGRRITVCVRALRGPVALYGNAGVAAPESTLTVAGKPKDNDLTLRFLREPRSTLSRVPEMFRHAALFKVSWLGAWAFWILAALVLLATPALAVVALRAAGRDD